MIKVGIIGTNGVPAQYGGYETLVENLLSFKKNKDIQYYIYCSGRRRGRSDTFKGARLIFIPLKANGMQAVLYDLISYLHALKHTDLVLSLGTLAHLISPFTRLLTKKKVVTNLDGMDHKREKWNIFAKGIISSARYFAIRHSDAIIADNQAVKKALYLATKKSSELIEYGGDHDDYRNADDAYTEYGLQKQGYFFKVCRIEPENNIALVLQAFSMLPKEKLVIVGNWESSRFGKEMRAQYGGLKNIFLLDPIYDTTKLNGLRAFCKAYIHGHSMGGTNPSLVEAMCLRLPVISFDNVFNRFTTENEAVFFKNHDELLSVIRNIEDDNLKRIADKMESIAERRYKWNVIAARYESLMLKTFEN